LFLRDGEIDPPALVREYRVNAPELIRHFPAEQSSLSETAFEERGPISFGVILTLESSAKTPQQGGKMTTALESQQNRLRTFANIFKGYMGIMPIITAALAPLATVMNVLPVFESQRKPLAAIAGMLGFLLLAWLFYIRRTIALGSVTSGFRWFFNVSPLILIFGSIACYIAYSSTLDSSVTSVSKLDSSINRVTTLSSWGQNRSIPESTQLQLLYLGMFLCAEAAFVMMALREYANDVRQISEYDWMFGSQDGSGLPLTSNLDKH
jgi:hypothetical protein